METRRLLFGKNPKKIDRLGRTLQMAKYATQLATPPDAYNNLTRVYDNLRISDPARLFGMDGNDSYGDCVMAGTAHLVTAYNGLIGKKKVPTKCSVVRQYKRLTGGQDTGLNELDTLKTWKNSGFFGEKIMAFVENDVSKAMQIKQSIWLFGGIMIGFNVQEDAISDFEAHKIWTPGNSTGDGHCVVVMSYSKDLVGLLTWGGFQLATWDWFFAQVDESYTILPLEAEIPGFAPGFPYDVLQTDINSVSK